MRRGPSAFLGTMILALLLTFFGLFAQARTSLNVLIDGEPVPDGLVRLRSGQLVVSAAALQSIEPLRVSRDQDAIELGMGGRVLTAVPGASTGLLDGQSIPLDPPVTVEGDDVTLPLRALAELAGWRIRFDPRERVLELVSIAPKGSQPVGDGPAVDDAPPPAEAMADTLLPSGESSTLSSEPTAIASAEEEARDEGYGDSFSTAPPESEEIAEGALGESDRLFDFAQRRAALERRRQRLMERANAPVADETAAPIESDHHRLPSAEPAAAADGSMRVISGVRVASAGGRQRVHIEADGPFAFESHLLSEPSRLVIDVPGAIWEADRIREVYPGPVVRRIRAGQHQADSVRIVIDVDAPVRFQSEAGERGVVLALHHQVGEVRVWSSPSGPMIDLTASGQLEPTVSTLIDPYRLVIDIPHSSLVSGSQEGEGPGPAIRRWRISQFDPDTVRLVLEMNRPLTVRRSSFFRADADEPGGAGWPGYGGVQRLALGTVMKGIGVEPAPPGWALLIEGESALTAHVSRLFDPHRVLIDLPGAVLPADWAPLTIGSASGVERVRVGRNRPDLVRVVVDTEVPMAFQVFRSPEEERLVVLMQPSGLAGTHIVIDPGHGGRDQGAIGVTGLREAAVNLQLARMLGARLIAEGARVSWTRQDDRYIPLHERAEIANRLGADLFISIHNNSCPEHCTGTGTETYFLPGRWENQVLAVSLQEELVRSIALEDRGIKQRNLAVLRHSNVPAALVEVAFLSSRREEALLRDPDFLARAADGLYRGVRRYVAEIASDATPGLMGVEADVASVIERLLRDGLAGAAYVMVEEEPAGDARPTHRALLTRDSQQAGSGGS